MPLIAKCKKIVSFFKSSTIANEKLKAEQEVEHPYGLIQEVPTRWNSALFMMQRIILINKEISTILLKLPKAPSPLNAEEIEILQEITEILYPFYEATLQVSANKTCTISLVIPIISELYQKFNLIAVKSAISIFILNLIQTRLPERFSSYEARTASRIATILDPRFKKDGFNSPSNAEQALEEEVYTYLSKPSPAVPPTSSEIPLKKKATNEKFTFLKS